MHRSLIVLLAGLVPAATHAGLIALWKLDATPADQVADYPLVWAGGESYAEAVAAPASAAAADFNGSNWLSAGGGLVFERNRPFSASAWIKGGAQDSAILGDMDQSGSQKGWEFHVGSTENGAPGNSVTVWLNNDYPAVSIQVNASANVLDGRWHHVAFSYDGGSTAAGLRIYIDGSPAAASAALDTLTADIAGNGTAVFNIGSRMQGVAHNFTGGIDEAALFGHELNASEVLAIYQSGVESVSAPLIVDRIPLQGQHVATLTSAEVLFSYPVTGVSASDLRVNGSPATGVTTIDVKRYRFTFPQPPQGDVVFTWAEDHRITGTSGLAAQPAPWTALATPTLPPAQVMISEFLTRNVGGLEDEDHDTPDWIELHNTGSADVDLAGWSLTNDPDWPQRWKLPSVTLRPGEYKIVFASGKDRLADTLHADFKLPQEGGYLALADPAGALFHVYDRYPPQEGNVSFGLTSAGRPAYGRKAWCYQVPSPGTAQGRVTFSSAAFVQTGFSPAVPESRQPITVTFRQAPEITPTGIPSLYYRAAASGEKKIDFADDGQHGDGAAGDLLWGAVIPAGTAPGQMVRWRISLKSDSAGESRWPVASPGLSTMYALPNYEGTVVSGGLSSAEMPFYQVFSQFGSEIQFNSTTGGRGAIFAAGKLYDNVLIRAKGTTSLNLNKRSHRIDFNPGRELAWSGLYPPQRELNLNSEYVDPSYLRQNMQLWMHRDSGGAGAPHFPVKVTLNNANWKLAFHTYSADSELLETMGLDPKGALYKQVWTLGSASGEKKTRRWEGNADLAQLVSGLSAGTSADARSRYIHDNLHLPSVINYLAVARIAQEGDDVWANMTVYRDSEGSSEWRVIPFDLNLSFGQLYFGGDIENTVVHATNDDNKSHPLYGTSSCRSNTGSGAHNQLYEAVIKTPDTRAMLLRRMRTLMDRYLSTDAATSPLEARFDAMGAAIRTEADLDRAKWRWPANSGPYGLGPDITPAQGLATLKSSFLEPRRAHLYATHSIHNTSKPIGLGNNDNAGIPDAQLSNPDIRFGKVESQPASGNPDQEYIELVNPGADAADVSDWTLRGATGRFKLAAGTVITAGGSLFVSPDVKAFRARSVSPKGDENRCVVGPYSGHLSPYGETFRLEDQNGVLVTRIQVPADPHAPPVSLVITEIHSNSAHPDARADGDWWELTNNAVHPIDLTGFSWDDNHQTPYQAVFPPVLVQPGESVIILDEDDPASFRGVWNLPQDTRILTRGDFGVDAFRSLGNSDSVILYQPDGTQAARADYPSHASGTSRAWLRGGMPVPGGYSSSGLFGARFSNAAPPDLASPGSAAVDPTVASTPYGAWTTLHDLWGNPSDAGADPDGDGLSNRAEYAFGGNPRIADSLPPSAMERDGASIEWTFTRRADDPSLVFGLEASADLRVWAPVSLNLLRSTADPDHPGHVRETHAISPSGNARFFRVRAE